MLRRVHLSALGGSHDELVMVREDTGAFASVAHFPERSLRRVGEEPDPTQPGFRFEVTAKRDDAIASRR